MGVTVSNDIPKDFDPETYLKLNPDVKAAGFSPILHWLNFGKHEARKYKEENLSCFKLFYAANKGEYKKVEREGLNDHLKELQLLTPNNEKPFNLKGYSLAANSVVDFKVDFQHAKFPNVNWRERVLCPISMLNNRMRFTLMIIDMLGKLWADDPIWVMEYVTPFYKSLKDRYTNLVGSEYVDSDLVSGQLTKDGILHQDATSVSFEDLSFKAVLSFDVFEHIPNYQVAFCEAYRVLKKNGKLIFSVPFDPQSDTTLIKAKVNSDGIIEHILEPEYHGDPMSSNGVLCFQMFGWDIIDTLKRVGFNDAHAVIGWSLSLGFPTPQIVFFAQK